MSAIAQSMLPIPKSWDEFEEMIWDLQQLKSGNDCTTNRYGRAGQRQHGVDIFVHRPSDAFLLGIQCKRYDEGTVTAKMVEAEVEKATRFQPALTRYTIATTDKRDAVLQSWLIEFNNERAARNLFLVELQTWEVIANRLSDTVARDVLFKYYGDWMRGFEAALQFGESEVADYLKMKIDRIVLSVIDQARRIYFQDSPFSTKDVTVFLSQTPDSLNEEIARKQLLGFYLFKKWDSHLLAFESILTDPLIATKLSTKQLAPIVDLLQVIVSLDTIREIRELFEEQGAAAPNLRTASGQAMGPLNDKYPDRLLLLESISADKARVLNFGDFRSGDHPFVLRMFRARPERVPFLSNRIHRLVSGTQRWLDVSGNEFILDPKTFRLSAS